jgi:hypothetical protein
MKESSAKSLLLFVSFLVILCGGYVVFSQLSDHKKISLDGNNAGKYFSEDGLPKYDFASNNKSSFSTNHGGKKGLISSLTNNEDNLNENQTEVSNNQVDFPTIDNSSIRKKVQVSIDNSAKSSNLVGYNAISSYNHSQNNYNTQQQVSEKVNTYSNTRSNVTNSVTPTLDAYATKSKVGGSQMLSESYIADNSASLLINNFDITGNANSNGRMLLDGNSNPGDPGIIPVGDGILTLLLFVLAYTFWVFKFRVK